jgi:hypothetical protein
MPEGEWSGVSWDVVARLDSGDLVVAQAFVSNLGPGDRNAGVLGWWIGSDGEPFRFKRNEPEGEWNLVDGGLDLHSIEVEPAAKPRRFVVDKEEVGIELVVRGPSAGAPPRSAGGDCSFELLDTASPADASLRRERGTGTRKTTGRVAWTHRSATALESTCAQRRLELFVLEDGLGVYFVERTDPAGGTHPFAVATQGERVLFRGEPTDVAVEWEAADDGFPRPASLRFRAGDVAARVDFGATLVAIDPTERLPAAVRLLMASQMQPRLFFSRAPFELELAGAPERRASFRGEAVAKVSYSNPVPAGRADARPHAATRRAAP